MLSQKELLSYLLQEAEQEPRQFLPDHNTTSFDVCHYIWASEVLKHNTDPDALAEQEAEDLITRIRQSVIPVISHYLSVDGPL